jgi:Prenyltransferase and squalene oxidase repeat
VSRLSPSSTPSGATNVTGRTASFLHALVWTIIVWSSAPFGTMALSAEPRQVKAAAEKSIALLQRCNPEFFRQTGCVACHQHSVASLAVGEARRRGLAVDEQSAREQLQITALVVKSMRTRFLERVDHPLNSAPSAGYIALGFAAEKFPPDENTDAMIVELAGRQAADGSWTAFSHRPPLEASRVSATALAVRALQTYGPPGLKESLAARIERAGKWIASAEPKGNAEHAFRLLGLGWTGGQADAIRSQASSLLKMQHEDGGWPELPELASDAYATAMALYALRVGAGISAADPNYVRGVDYLLRTQLDDGSWHVKTRSLPIQPYFESGFPHGADQWISAAATGFAAVALMSTLPETVAENR